MKNRSILKTPKMNCKSLAVKTFPLFENLILLFSLFNIQGIFRPQIGCSNSVLVGVWCYFWRLFVLFSSTLSSLFWSELCLSLCVCTTVTWGIMGLSCSRQDVNAWNSNIKVFLAVPDTSSSLFLMPDWTERRLAHESRHSMQAASASHSHILLRLPNWSFFFSRLFTAAHTVPSQAPTTRFVWSEWQLIIHSFLGFFCSRNTVKEFDWAVQYIGTHVQVWCWQDISASQCTPHQRHSPLPHCIITMPSGQWKGLL